MFLKRVKGGSKNNPIYYFQIAESYRSKDGKPKHKTICTVGRVDEVIRDGTLKRFVESITRHLDDVALLDLEKENIKDVRLLGAVLVIEKAFKDLGLDRKLTSIASERKIRFDLVKAVKLMLINRIRAPSSKLSIMKWKERLYNCEDYEDVQAQHLYRSLDILAEEAEVLKKHTYHGIRPLSLFKPQVSVVYYDLTTLYFESEIADELKCFGYSKDNKADKVQVVLGVVLDEEGLPVTYELYPGSTFEGKTVIGMVRKLRKEYEVERVIFVGDRGLVSKRVLEELERLGCGYVLGARIKKLPEVVKEEIIQSSGWEELTQDLRVKEIRVGDRRLVVYKSQLLEKEERNRRQKVLEWIKDQLMKNPKRLMVKRGYSRYIEVEGADIRLNGEAIEKEARLDGVFGFWCKGEEVGKENAYKVYKQLWRVEEAFRSMKSGLKIRPIYHWTPKRIKGHVAMCYLAFCVCRLLESRLKEAGVTLSLREALEELNRVAAVGLETKKGLLDVRTEVKGVQYELFRALHTKIPSVVLKRPAGARTNQK